MSIDLFAAIFSFLGVVACNNNNSTSNITHEERATETKTTQASTIDSTNVKFGKYGCTATKFVKGDVEYEPRGFLTLGKSGTYSYEGFKEPSTGKYSVDNKGNLHFTGGYLDGGEATKIDRPNKYFLVFPSIPDSRWTCGYIE